jgi:hypothetical protein
MRKTLCAAAFVLVLCGSALAGDIPMPLPPQPPPGMTVEEQVTDVGMQNDEPDSLTETVLSALESLLSIF